MSNSKCIIYVATSPSGRCYVGKTTTGLKNRVRVHIKSKNIYDYAFYRALRKYGESNFSWAVLYDDVDEDLLNAAEICAIYVLESYYSGYNSTLGGEGRVGGRLTDVQRKAMLERMSGDSNPAKRKAVREKISTANKGKKPWNKGIPRSEETKKKLSLANSGKAPEEHSFFGKHHSEASKLKMSKAQTGLQAGEKNPFFGKKHTEETKLKMSMNHKDSSGDKNSFFGKKHSEETKLKMRGPRKKSKKTKILSAGEMKEIRDRYETGNYSFRKLAVEYGVSKTAISNTIKLKTQRSKESLKLK